MSTLRIALPIAISLLAGGAVAQEVTAEAYFNQASREFVKVDKMTAMRTLDRGLQAYPGDPKLLKLAEALLKDEEKKQQQEQNKDQQGKDKEKQDQDGKNEQQEQDQGKPEDRQQQEPQQEKNEPPQQADNSRKEEQRKGEEANNIAPQDAMRMLDALERSEKDIQEKVRLRRRPVTRQNIEKDW